MNSLLADATAPRFLIVRLSAIGDVIHGLPVLTTLRAAWPQAFIAWVVEGRAAELLAGHPALDVVVNVKRGWLKRPSSVLDLRSRLRSLDVDVAIDLQGLTKSAVAARLSGARRRIGFGGVDGREISPWLNNVRISAAATHVIDRNLELLRPLGIQADPAGSHDATELFNLPETRESVATATNLLNADPALVNFALVNPGAGWPSKLWPPDRFGAVAEYLGRRHRLSSLVVWAGEKEHGWAVEIVDRSGGHARLAPATTLCELAALARRATLFVSADTGPLHLAVAVGTPSIGLFGPMPAERNGPYGPAHLALQKVWLTGSSRSRRTADNASMQAISVDDVTAACDVLLARSKARRCA
ncbi:MAG TPA: glycosyltransferase family 9 protein [Pirellulales bacterium]